MSSAENYFSLHYILHKFNNLVFLYAVITHLIVLYKIKFSTTNYLIIRMSLLDKYSNKFQILYGFKQINILVCYVYYMCSQIFIHPFYTIQMFTVCSISYMT